VRSAFSLCNVVYLFLYCWFSIIIGIGESKLLRDEHVVMGCLALMKYIPELSFECLVPVDIDNDNEFAL
jgi:hypothetical protein